MVCDYLIFSTRSKIKEYSKLALDNNLFFSDRSSYMESVLRKKENIEKISLCQFNGYIIGAAILLKKDAYDVMVYVKEKYRRRGIGTKLVKKLTNNNEIKVCNSNGKLEDGKIINRRKFWNSIFK